MAGNFLPGTASLLEDLDKKLMVLLRDGRTLIGYLRSIDQFANLVLHRTIERIHVGNKFADMPRGIFIIRGENVVLCGEVSEETAESESDDGDSSTAGYGAGHHESLIRVDVEEILELQQNELLAKQERDKLRLKAAQESGLTVNYETLLDDF